MYAITDHSVISRPLFVDLTIVVFPAAWCFLSYSCDWYRDLEQLNIPVIVSEVTACEWYLDSEQLNILAIVSEVTDI